MDIDLKVVAENIRRATTEDLLDRVTIYRAEMEPAAVDLMGNELARRGYRPEMIAGHEQLRLEHARFAADGTAIRCTRCDRPSVARRWSWWKLFGRLPIVPLPTELCAEHQPQPMTD